MKAVLGLEDGTSMVGEGFGVEGETAGELVFTTQMTGYMEALTDASYAGQILMFTFPQIGNYGVDEKNFQSTEVKALACVTREVATVPEANEPMGRYFRDHGLLGVTGIDTRALTIRTRQHGTLRAALVCGDDASAEHAVERARAVPPITEQDLIPLVSTAEPYHVPGGGKRVAVIDLGVKKNMVISLFRRGADIGVFPHDTRSDVIEAWNPDALFITNGPGDPVRATAAIQCIRDLIGRMPVYGICMGNQLTALALGATTHKMKFGHRGSNQPVRFSDGQIFITTQNHGFVVDCESLPEGANACYTNLNDGTVEGFEVPDLGIHCVQFHPEAHGGPRDTESHFFDRMMRSI
ncbi:MAG TPA: glutamine-hydrolyzing carbamoyl-phosphate synthase small subunit [Methanoregulaceae archaeon]|nr:glutamine-hydrolyzing carbamoyl-phosphate synthase small subunit [Methanoregulaceae archaeon]